MSLVDVIDQELDTFNTLLETIPFAPGLAPSAFLKVYRLNYPELHHHQHEHPPPLDPEKLVKLCISFGNLMRSLSLDEESYRVQQNLTLTLGLKLASLATDSSSYESPRHFIGASAASQPTYQTKFLRNLLVILKSFDIGRHELPLSLLNSTISQYTSSPIKLNSKQLLIEKLEINIQLDTLFVFKVLIQLLIRIFTVLREHLLLMTELPMLLPQLQPQTPGLENSSIFSINSGQSGSSDSFLSSEECFKVVQQILHRVSTGLIEPLLKYLMEFVTTNVSSEFETLIESL